MSLQEEGSFFFFDTNLQQSEVLYFMNELPWEKSSKTLHSNRWKAILVLSSLKTYTIFFECFVALVLSELFQTLFSRLISCDFLERHVSLASQTLSVSAAAPIAYRIQVLEAISAAEQKGSGL